MPRVDDGRIRTDDVEVNWDDGEIVGAEAAGEAPSSFAALLLRAEVVQGLEKEGYLRPSPIQVEIMPPPQEFRGPSAFLCFALL
jgi:superfamily II DNA/RNA helicase